MAEELLGYSGNLQPLSITQDATVRAPKELDTRVSVSPTDNGDRTWETIGKGILETANLISTSFNTYNRIQDKKQSELLEQRKHEITNELTQFDAITTANEVEAMKSGVSYDYATRGNDFNTLVSKYGTFDADKGYVPNYEASIFEGLNEDNKKKLFTHINSQGTQTYKGITSKYLQVVKDNAKDTIQDKIETTSTGVLRANVNVYNEFSTIGKDKTTGLSALGITNQQFIDDGYASTTRALSLYKNDVGFLRKFLKTNADTPEEFQTTSWNVMMAQAESYLSSKVDTIRTATKNDFIEKRDAGYLAPLVPIIEKKRAYELYGNTPEGAKYKLTEEETELYKVWSHKYAVMSGFNDPNAVDNGLYKEVMTSLDMSTGALITGAIQRGDLVSQSEYDRVSGDQKSRLNGVITNNIKYDIAFLMDPENAKDTLGMDKASKRLVHYASFPGQTEKIKQTFETYKSSVINMYMKEAPEAIAPAVAKIMTDMPEGIFALIPSKDQTDYKLAQFVANNPQYSLGYQELLLGNKSMDEAIKVNSNSFSKEKSEAIKEAGGYGREANEYFDTVLALTKDPKVAKEQTVRHFGSTDDYGITMSPFTQDKIVAAGINSKELMTYFKEEVNTFLNTKASNIDPTTLKIVDIDGHTTKIAFTTKQGTPGQVFITDATLDATIKRVKNTFAEWQYNKGKRIIEYSGKVDPNFDLDLLELNPD